MDNVFIFSDSFLNITFIEIQNSELNYLEVDEDYTDILNKKVFIKNLLNKDDIPFFKGEIKFLWGFFLLFNTITNSNLYGSPIFLNNKKVIGIHQFSNDEISFGGNIETIIQALKIARISNYKYKRILTSKPKILNNSEISILINKI